MFAYTKELMAFQPPPGPKNHVMTCHFQTERADPESKRIGMNEHFLESPRTEVVFGGITTSQIF